MALGGWGSYSRLLSGASLPRGRVLAACTGGAGNGAQATFGGDWRTPGRCRCTGGPGRCGREPRTAVAGMAVAVAVSSGREALPGRAAAIAAGGAVVSCRNHMAPAFPWREPGWALPRACTNSPLCSPSMGVEQRGCTEPGPLSPRASSPASPGTCECHRHLRTPGDAACPRGDAGHGGGG